MPTSEWRRNWSLESLDKAIAELKEYISELEAKANEVTGKIMPVTPVDRMFGKRFTSIDSYGKEGSFLCQPHFSKAVHAARDHCWKIWEEVCNTHEVNKAAIENNKALYDKIVLLMHNIGIPSESVEYLLKRNGRRAKEPSRKPAGYLTDLHRCLLRDDGFSTAEREYEKFLKQIEEYEKKKLQEEVVAKRAKELEEKKEESEKIRATLVIKYGLPYSSDFREVLEHILGQNKFLRLAYFLQRTAYDWNDGPDQAEFGLQGFVPENAEEEKIHKEILALLENWDGDGRVFRDCQYGYSYLYDVARKESPALVEDFLLCVEALDIRER
jgi:hypothetical protein